MSIPPSNMMTMMMNNEFSLSSRELRQMRRNIKKENKSDMVSPILSDIEDDDDSDFEMAIEYNTKENTRKVKRSHEKKEKKRIIREDESNSSDEEYLPYAAPVKKENTRNGRRNAAKENITPPSDKHVSFEEEKQPKPFRNPKGRFTHAKIFALKTLEKKNAEHVQQIRTSPRNRQSMNYYESDFEYDDEKDEEYVLEEEESFSFQ